ncbi:unnamed protein product [Triticum turgidum subsp. durum]|uniref:Transcription initiation factor TFIID subunit 9 n=1 Tax=Triticum turgidum subsp. durum TaxID=4567 RepID=A0A9R0RVM1_TRITD|nr:unnamed protein product [Triticum turgidum subsp. durum]
MGLGEGEYEPRVVHQFLDLAYRYVGDVLGDAQVYADHAAKPQLDADDVRLAIQAKVNFSFSQPPPREQMWDSNPDSSQVVHYQYHLTTRTKMTPLSFRKLELTELLPVWWDIIREFRDLNPRVQLVAETNTFSMTRLYGYGKYRISDPSGKRRETDTQFKVLLELARSRNKIPLPKSIAPPGSIPLPPEQDTLLTENYQLLPALKPPTQTEEAEDDNEGADAIPGNPSPNYSQDQRGNEQRQPQSQSQRVSFQLNAVAATAAKRPLVTIDQLNMG